MSRRCGSPPGAEAGPPREHHIEFQQVVDARRMVRRFTDEPVDPAVVDRAVRNATRAPNAGFAQGWGFLVLDTPEDVLGFWRATSDAAQEGGRPDRWLAGLMTAPVLVLPCSDEQAYLERYAEPDKGWVDDQGRPDASRWAMPYWHLDTAMAALLVLQTAVDAGLGGCFFGLPREREPQVRERLGLPERLQPVGVIALGHPAPGARSGSPRARARRDLDDVRRRGRWER